MDEVNAREEVLLSELPGGYNRETVTLLTGTAYKAGQVLGKITSGGKYTICDNVTPAEDGSQTAVAVLLRDVDATGGDALGPIVEGPGVQVAAALLQYKSNANDAQKLAQRTALRTAGVKAR